MSAPNPREIKRAPPHQSPVICLWCNAKMLARCLSRNNHRLKHSYQSYCIAAQPSVFSLFGGTSTQSKNTKINKNKEENKPDKKIDLKIEANKNEDSRADKEIKIKNEDNKAPKKIDIKNKANKNEDNKADKKIDIKNEANKIEIQSAANKIEEQNEEIKKISKKKMGSREKNLSKKNLEKN